jgi:CHAT domain-containing protein
MGSCSQKPLTANGLLTMAEIVDLDLDADWVLLSACNTATANAAGAEAFSGLGRAFFQAGARSLLVSHWPVMSAPTRDLMVAVFEGYRSGEIGRAEALRQGMTRLIEAGQGEQPIGTIAYAHPMIWAPFELLGDPG